MKYFLVIACFVVAANAVSKEFTESFMAKMTEVGQICSEQTKATSDDIAKLISHEIPDTQEGKCMIFCFHKHFNVQNPDGSPNLAGALASLEPLKADDADVYEKVKSLMTTCETKAPVDADPCVTAANLAECGMAEGKAMGLKRDMFEL